MIDVVPLKYGVTFKKAFGHKDVFCQLAHDVLGISINVDEIFQEKEFDVAIGRVKTRYDLFAEDKQKRIIVEIQRTWQSDFYDRFLHYHLSSIVEQAESHEEYSIPKTVYSIVILTSVPRNNKVTSSLATSDMDLSGELGEKLHIYNHRLVFLNPRLINKNTPANMLKWMELIRDSLDGKIDEKQYPSPIFQKGIADIKDDNISSEERGKLKDEAAFEKSKPQSFEEGMEKRGLEIARNMLQKKIEIGLISEITGLTPEEISQLKATL